MNVFRVILLMFVVGTVSAETVRFRSGTLLAAELSATPPAMAKLDSLIFPSLPENKIFGIIIFKLDPLRQISIYDYSLRSFGQNFPCVGIWQNNRFQFNDSEVGGSEIQALLFVLDGRLVGLKKSEELELVANCPPESIASQRIIFNIVPRLHVPAQVPKSGLMVNKL